MDTKRVRSEWEEVHNGSRKTFCENILDHGLEYKPTVTRKELLYGHPEVWIESYFRACHPYRYRCRQCVNKIINCGNETLHWTWYWCVYLYYLTLYFLLFLGPGCTLNRDSFP